MINQERSVSVLSKYFFKAVTCGITSDTHDSPELVILVISNKTYVYMYVLQIIRAQIKL